MQTIQDEFIFQSCYRIDMEKNHFSTWIHYDKKAMSKKIEIAIEQLRQMLNDQKRKCGEYMTRNMSIYGDDWINFPKDIHEKMKQEAFNSEFPDEFETLKKYLG